jgi:hypothetical protein
MIGNPEALSLIQNHFNVQEIRSHQEGRWAVLYREEGAIPGIIRDFFQSFEKVYLFSPRRPEPFLKRLRQTGQEALAWIPSLPDVGEKIPLDALQRQVLKSEDIPWIDRIPRISPSSQDLGESSRIIGRLGLGSDKDPTLLAIHPGSGDPRKNWPLEGFLEVAEKVSRQGRATPFFVLGPVEGERNPQWGEKIKGRGFPLLANLPLRLLSGILACCRFYLGNDSGVSHLAAALGLTTLVLFGPTDPSLWAPRGDRVAVISGSNRKKNEAEKIRLETGQGCLDCLPVAEVLRQAESVMGRFQEGEQDNPGR